MPISTRERLHHTMCTGAPFMGIIKNKRYFGNGSWEVFENLLHMVVVFAGVRSYILGMQVNVTGLNLDLKDGSEDVARLQLVFDSVLSGPGAETWMNYQEAEFHAAPLYLYIRHAGDSNDEVEIVEGQYQNQQGRAVQQIPDQYLVLAPQFMPLHHLQDKPKPSRWEDESIDAGPDASYAPSRTPSSPWRREVLYEQELQYKTRAEREEAVCESPSSGNETLSLTTAVPQGCISEQPGSHLEYHAELPDTDAVGTPTMKTQLRALDLEDPDAVIIARGISKLGLTAGETLRHYFAAFGEVKGVHIPYTFKKRKRSKHTPANDASSRETRAPGRCFIVMTYPNERTKILAGAKQHVVHGVTVTLEAFSAKPYDGEGEALEGDDEMPQ